MNFKKYTLSILLLLIFLGSFAQTKKADTLLIDEINVVKSFDPKLKEAFKINSNPVLSDSVPKTKPMSYSFLNKTIENQITTDTIKASLIKGGEPLAKFNRGYAKLGIGNYTTPLVDIYYNSLRSKNHSLGFYYNHLSSAGNIKNYPTSSFSDNKIGVLGKYFFNKTILSGDINYNRNKVYYYGVDQDFYQNLLTNNSTLFNNEKQVYTKFDANINLVTSESNKLNYDLGIKFYNFSDNFSAKENKLSFVSKFIKPIGSEKINVRFNSDYYNSIIPGFIYDNTILTLAPSIISKKENIDFKIGLITNASIDTTAKINIAPDAELKFHFIEKKYVSYIGVTGGLEKNSFESITKNNPYVSLTNIQLKNSNTIYKAYAGVKGPLATNAYFGLEVSHRVVNNMPLFYNSYNSGLENKMNVIYDKVQQTTIGGEISYNISEKVSLITKGSYYITKADSQSQAWNIPTFDASLSARYHLKKITFNSSIFIIGNRKAIDYLTTIINTTNIVTVAESTIKPIVDLNLGVDYDYTKNLAAFIQLNNIVNQQQFIFNNYSSQGIRILGGVKFSF